MSASTQTKAAKAPVAKAPVAKPAPAAKAAPAPVAGSYTLTAKGKALVPSPASLRGKAWALVVQHAGKPGSMAALAAAMPKGSHGSITAANLTGWALKHGLLTKG